MARDRATIRTDMWGDDDWRDLTPGAQWLYEYLLTSPSLSYVGIADWRPVRVAKLARSLTTDAVAKYVSELDAARFVFVDDETEEVVVRSFLRHDPVLQNPNLWKSIGKDFAAVASKRLREVIVREVLRLREEFPTGWKANPWVSRDLQTMLNTPTRTAPGTPSDSPSDTGSARGSDRGSDTATSTSTPTEASLPAGEAKLKEHRLPKDWAPIATHFDLAKTLGVDVAAEADVFRLHAETHDRHAARWNAAFTTWLKKARPSASKVEAEFGQDEWMMRA